MRKVLEPSIEQSKNTAIRELREETGWVLNDKNKLKYIASDKYTNVFLLNLSYTDYINVKNCINIKNNNIYREVSNIRFVSEDYINSISKKIGEFNSKSTNAWKIYKKLKTPFTQFNNKHVTIIIKYTDNKQTTTYLICDETRWINTSDDINIKLKGWDYDCLTYEYETISMKKNRLIFYENLNCDILQKSSQLEKYIENTIKNTKYNIDKKGGHIRTSSGKSGFIKGHIETYDITS